MTETVTVRLDDLRRFIERANWTPAAKAMGWFLKGFRPPDWPK